MSKKGHGGVGHKAWSLLRLALLWARKGGVFKRRFMMELRVLPKHLKSLTHSTAHRDRIHYGERQLSFDDTPIFHVKMHRPASMRYLIPCINPQVDFDYDFGSDDEDGVYGYDCGRRSFLKHGEDQVEEDIGGCEEKGQAEEEEGIDVKAEKFIADFYEQIKLQRQISYLQYNEMINRGSS